MGGELQKGGRRAPEGWEASSRRVGGELQKGGRRVPEGWEASSRRVGGGGPVKDGVQKLKRNVLG